MKTRCQCGKPEGIYNIVYEKDLDNMIGYPEAITADLHFKAATMTCERCGAGICQDCRAVMYQGLTNSAWNNKQLCNICSEDAMIESIATMRYSKKEFNEVLDAALEYRRENASLAKERDHWRQAYCTAEQETARMEAWATDLWKKLHAIECGDCGKNMVACKWDE